jgi:hypothetical protein
MVMQASVVICLVASLRRRIEMEVQEDSKCVGCGVKDWIIQDEDGRWCGDCVSRESADAVWIAIEASKKEPIFKLQND